MHQSLGEINLKQTILLIGALVVVGGLLWSRNADLKSDYVSPLKGKTVVSAAFGDPRVMPDSPLAGAPAGERDLRIAVATGTPYSYGLVDTTYTPTDETYPEIYDSALVHFGSYGGVDRTVIASTREAFELGPWNEYVYLRAQSKRLPDTVFFCVDLAHSDAYAGTCPTIVFDARENAYMFVATSTAMVSFGAVRPEFEYQEASLSWDDAPSGYRTLYLFDLYNGTQVSLKTLKAGESFASYFDFFDGTPHAAISWINSHSLSVEVYGPGPDTPDGPTRQKIRTERIVVP